jgi:hypothetical protein
MLKLNGTAGFQYRQPTRQSNIEIRQPIYKSHFHNDNVVFARG